MFKKKTVIYLLVFFATLIFPSKTVFLEVLDTTLVTRTYNNYYFFIEPFSDEYADMETVNYGLFAPPRLGHFADVEPYLVELRRTSSNSDEDVIDTFYKFYKKKNITKSADFIPLRVITENGIPENQYCMISSYENVKGNITDVYYTHSCYKNMNGSWDGYYVINEEGKYCDKKGNCVVPGTQVVSSLNELKYACASVNRFSAAGAKIEPVLSAVDGVATSNEHYVYKITRANLSITTGTPTNYSVVKIGSKFDDNSYNSGCPNNNEYYVNPTSDDKMYSPVLGKYSYNVNYYTCIEKPIEEESNCNTSKTVDQECSYTTIETGNNNNGTLARANFGFYQEGTVSNVLSPSTIYQGGGINIGFTYYNTVNWKYIPNDVIGFEYGINLTEDEAKAQLLAAVKDRIKREEEIENNLTVNFSFSPVVDLNEDISNNLIKHCEQFVTGTFEEGKAVTTCTVFLPVTNIQPYTGNISGISAIEGSGINNKMYTELHYSGELNFSAVASGLNVLRNSAEWSIEYNPDHDDNSCQVYVYNRLYAEKNAGDKSNRYKFIYRPIDLNNPFPGRNAGANWYDWYKKDNNKDRLKDSYSKKQYRVDLNPARVAKIKEYNQEKNYFDWDGFENDQSSFINGSEFGDFFTVKGQNIVGDSS